MRRPFTGEYPPFAETYINKVPETDILSVLASDIDVLESFLESIPSGKADYAYAPGKWTVKQTIQHIIDTERIFAYRALAIARGEAQSLPGFDQDEYAAKAIVSTRSLESLTEEMSLVRVSSAILFKHFTEEQWLTKGTASNHTITPLSLAYMIVGHWRHHQYLFEQAYGIGG